MGKRNYFLNELEIQKNRINKNAFPIYSCFNYNVGSTDVDDNPCTQLYCKYDNTQTSCYTVSTAPDKTICDAGKV
jgi:hypothetical protein